jgi:uncharacterized protein (DUF305 family)
MRPGPGFSKQVARALVVACALLGAAVLTGCMGEGDDEASDTEPRIVQPGAPGEEPRELTPEEAEDLELPSHTDADVSFMQGMILHHEQALDMTALVPDRTAREDVPLLARRLEVSQLDEIERMEAWLESRGEDATDHDAHAHSSHLPGMLTAEQLAALGAASGRRFDRLFLRSMIRHHEGAIAMVEQLQEDGGGQEPEISTFTNHVVADQGVEISRMSTLLSELSG